MDLSLTNDLAMSHDAHWEEPRRKVALWTGVLAGPFAFLLNLQLAYMWVPTACRDGAGALLHLTAGATLLLALGGGALSWRLWRKAGREWPDEAGYAVVRSRFLAVLGILASGLFGLVILAQWLPIFFYDPCQ